MRLMSFFPPLKKPLTEVSQSRGSGSSPLSAAVTLLWTWGAAAAVIASLVCLAGVEHHAGEPDPEDRPGSGTIIRTEVTAIWAPQALCDLARHKADPPMELSPERLQTCLARSGWRDAWYALTYRGHQANGGIGEMTQIRRLSEAADHLDELHAVMATAAGRPPQFEGPDFSHARVKVIPDTMRAMDPREAITRLMAEPIVRENRSQTEAFARP
jgi:hypothetical protein